MSIASSIESLKNQHPLGLTRKQIRKSDLESAPETPRGALKISVTEQIRLRNTVHKHHEATKALQLK